MIQTIYSCDHCGLLLDPSEGFSRTANGTWIASGVVDRTAHTITGVANLTQHKIHACSMSHARATDLIETKQDYICTDPSRCTCNHALSAHGGTFPHCAGPCAMCKCIQFSPRPATSQLLLLDRKQLSANDNG